MDLSKPGPLYDAIRNHLGIDEIERRRDDHGRRLADLERERHAIPEHEHTDPRPHRDAHGRIEERLRAIEGTVTGLERRTNHQTVDDLEERLRVVEERLEKMPKPRSRAKPKPVEKAKR